MADNESQDGRSDQTDSMALEQEVHLFSNQAFDLAKDFVAGKDAAVLKEQARKLEPRVPELAARAKTADPAYRPDLNRALADARLDLDYVLADGGRPSSTRLHYFQNEQAQS
jgi:hypothetical protein